MGKKIFTFGVFVGRFQPFHNAHLKVILEGLEQVNHLIILLGGAKAARSSKNPFTAEEREGFIRASLEEAGVPKGKYTILPVMDYHYNEQKWISEVQARILQVTKGNQDIALLGYKKDNSSYYLMSFPEWTFVPTKVEHILDATTVRNAYLAESTSDNPWPDMVPKKVFDFMLEFKYASGSTTTPLWNDLHEEFEYIRDYKAEQAKYPWPIIYSTVDAVVIKSGHILLVKRGGNPGKGLYALPGGFLSPDETIIESTVRELVEETGLKLLPQFIHAAAKETTVYDFPGRSLRGRTVTHATLFDLEGGQLPVVKGADDAAEAVWLSINEAISHPELFFEDHAHIIYASIMKY